MSKLIIQNLATEYQDEGEGKVILFLHGWQDNLRTFDSLVSFLALACRVIRLDLPGFGLSEAPKEAWNLDVYIKFVQEFIQKLNIKVDVLAGHSFGGRIIIKGEAEKKFQVGKIILIGSAGIAKKRVFRNLIFKILAKVGNMVTFIPPFIFWRELLRKKLYNFIGSDYNNAGSLKETFLKTVSEDLSEGAKKITKPALLIWGANDAATPLSDGERLSKMIRNAELKVIAGAGHFVHQEKPTEVAKFIQEFI